MLLVSGSVSLVHRKKNSEASRVGSRNPLSSQFLSEFLGEASICFTGTLLFQGQGWVNGFFVGRTCRYDVGVGVCVEMVVSCGAKFVCDFSAPKRYLTRGNWQKTLQTRLFKFSL